MWLKYYEVFVNLIICGKVGVLALVLDKRLKKEKEKKKKLHLN